VTVFAAGEADEADEADEAGEAGEADETGEAFFAAFFFFLFAALGAARRTAWGATDPNPVTVRRKPEKGRRYGERYRWDRKSRCYRRRRDRRIPNRP
jgi:hypothetical protein